MPSDMPGASRAAWSQTTKMCVPQVWDVERGLVDTQLIAHDKEVRAAYFTGVLLCCCKLHAVWSQGVAAVLEGTRLIAHDKQVGHVPRCTRCLPHLKSCTRFPHLNTALCLQL